MDGDIAPLDKIIELCKKYDCISMIDEAHATGVLGKNGAGASEFFNIEDKVDICMGTLSKAIGSIGGYVAGSFDLIDFLKNKARSFIFDTSLPASTLKASISAIRIIRENNSIRENLSNNIKNLSNFLDENQFPHFNSQTAIVPILIGGEKETLKVSDSLLSNGVFIPAVRPPSVPAGKSRIRITLMALHKKKHMDRLFESLFSI